MFVFLSFISPDIDELRLVIARLSALYEISSAITAVPIVKQHKPKSIPNKIFPKLLPLAFKAKQRLLEQRLNPELILFLITLNFLITYYSVLP